MVRTIGDLQISSVEIQQETIIDNGVIIQNVQNVLQSNQLISSQSNQARIESFAQLAPTDTTIMKIVQQVNVVQVVGGTTQSMSLFAQSDITANAGQAITNVIQITSQNIQAVTINGGGNNGGGINTLGAGNGVNAGNGKAGNAGNANLGAQGTGNVGAKKTTVKLGDAKPTWTSVVNDPAGTKAGGQAKATGGAKKGGKAAEGAAKGEAGAAKGEAGAKGAAKGEAGAAKGEAAAKGAEKGEAAAAKGEAAKGEAAKGEAAKGEAAKGEAAAAAEKPAAAAEKPAAAKGAVPPKPTKAANVPIFPAAGIQKV